LCKRAGIHISGYNTEVVSHQLEFQIGHLQPYQSQTRSH
jgi:hypothetical protein